MSGDRSDDRDPIEPLAEEFIERLRAGEHPSVEEYARRHPDLAESVRELLPAMVDMERLRDDSATSAHDFRMPVMRRGADPADGAPRAVTLDRRVCVRCALI